MSGKKYIYSFQVSKSGNEESSYFLTRGRISRSTFLSRLIFTLSLFLFFELVNNYYWGTNYPSYLVWIKFYNYLLPSFLLTFVFIQAGKRIHDINKSALNVFIPLLNIYYVSLVGTKGNNNYGIDPSPQKNIKYFDQIDSFEETNLSNTNRKEIIKIVAILILFFISFFGIKNNTGDAYGINANNAAQPVIDVRINVKKRGQLNIGFISVNALDKSTNACLLDVFNNVRIKYIKKDNLENSLQSLRENRVDLLLLSPSESIRIAEKYDRTNRFYIKSISRSATFLLPTENSDLVENLNACLSDFNVLK